MALVVPLYGNERETLRPVDRTAQRQPSDDGAARIGQAVGQIGQAVGQVAEMQERRLAALDEAEVQELDNDMAKWERQRLYGEGGVLTQTGRNALNARDPFVTEFGQQREALLARAQGTRQRAMLTRALDAREARSFTAVDTHTAREVETYRTETFNAHTAQAALDLASMPDDADRIPQFTALIGSIRAEGQRKGWSEEVTRAAILETTTNVHTGWVERMLNDPTADPNTVEAYLDQWAPQINGEKLTDLREATLRQVYRFDGLNFASQMPDRSPATATTVTTPVGRITLHPPVASGSISSPFGMRRSGMHRGVDRAVPVGTPVTAQADGVLRWRNDPDGYGRYAVIDHGNGVETREAHLSAANIPDGSRVVAGQIIGLSGGAVGSEGAGNSRGPHVHSEVRINGVAVDPEEARRTGVVAGGSTTSAVDANPATLEDVYEQADAYAESRRPGDWQYREAMRAAGVQNYGRLQQVATDRERQAADALAPYQRGGERYGQAVPSSIIENLSPPQRVAFNRERMDEAERQQEIVDRRQAFGAEQRLRDDAAYNPAAFARQDLNAYRGVVSDATLESLLGLQRTIRAAGPDADTRGQRAYSDYRTRAAGFLRNAGIKTGADATNEDLALASQFDNRMASEVTSFVALNDRAPTAPEMAAIASQMTRQVMVDQDGDGRYAAYNAFEVSGRGGLTVVPANMEGRVRAAFRRDNDNRNPTYAQLSAYYDQMLAAGDIR